MRRCGWILNREGCAHEAHCHSLSGVETGDLDGSDDKKEGGIVS